MEKLNAPYEDLPQIVPVTSEDPETSESKGKRKPSVVKRAPRKRTRRRIKMDPLDDSIEPDRDPLEESSEEEIDPSFADSKYLPTIIKPTPPPVGYFVPTPCRFRRRLKRYKKVDRRLPKLFQCRQRKDGTWVFHPKLFPELMKQAKDSPDYRNLKAKRFNTSFLKNTPRPQTIEIFSPGEVAGVPMPYIPHLKNITDGEPGQKYADVFRFLPRDESDDDDKKKKKEVKKRGRRKSLKWKGGPLADKNLEFNYDWLLDSDVVAGPSTSKTKNNATSKKKKKIATVNEKMASSGKKRGCIKKKERKSNNAEARKGKVTYKKQPLPGKTFSSSEDEDFSNHSFSSEDEDFSNHSFSSEDDNVGPSTSKIKNNATSKNKKATRTVHKKMATSENKKIVSEKKKGCMKRNEVKSKNEVSEAMHKNQLIPDKRFSSSEDDVARPATSVGMKIYTSNSMKISVISENKKKATSNNNKTAAVENKKIAASESKKTAISEKKKESRKKKEIVSNNKKVCKGKVIKKGLLPGETLYPSMNNDAVTKYSTGKSPKLFNKWNLLPGEQAIHNLILRVHLPRLSTGK